MRADAAGCCARDREADIHAAGDDLTADSGPNRIRGRKSDTSNGSDRSNCANQRRTRPCTDCNHGSDM
jgi:hypothetical protein